VSSGRRYGVVVIRPARRDDLEPILHLVRELAVYEREPEAVVATPEDYSAALFGPVPLVHCHVAEDAAGQVVGMALWYVTFSTWLGRHGLWLEDLFVLPERRREGHGRALLTTLARLCAERGYGRMEWWVLDWNTLALGFYRSIGASGMDDWTVQRLEGAALAALATGDPAPSGSVTGARGHDRTEGGGR
jgi:GNAT superfamily N-acetyltransferase